MVWRDKRDVCLLTNIHDPSREGSYRNEHGNARKPTIVADYNRQIGHVDNADRMAKSHTVSRRILSGEKSVFPHVGPEHCQKLHTFIFMWWEENLTQRFSTHPYQRDTRMGRAWATTIHAPASTNIGILDTRHRNHWPGRNPTKRRCRVCSATGVTWTEMFKCVKCEMTLCVDRNCVADYHTKNNLQDIFSSVLRSNSWSLNHNLSKRKMDIYKFFFFRNLSSPSRNKNITVFVRHTEQCLFPFPQNAFCSTDLSRLVLEIFRFFEKHSQNLNTPQNNSATWVL